jgi:chlorite dismutase
MSSVISPPYVWVRFLAASNERTLNSLINGKHNNLSSYRVRQVVPLKGDAPRSLGKGWRVARIENQVPPSLTRKGLSLGSSSAVQFLGVTEHLHYTSDTQRQELDTRAIPELEPSDHTTAVLIPISKSEEWWKLAQNQRYAYFQKTGGHEGHTAIGFEYVDRIFRRLYHSRYLGAALGYDFLTYFEFKDVYEKDFRALLSELRNTATNPEWTFIDREFEIWMTKIG